MFHSKRRPSMGASKAIRPWHRARRWSWRTAVGAGATSALLVAMTTPALANTSNPTSIHVVGVVNSDGTETVTVSGNWIWPAGMQCNQRYGTGWEIGWWGVGSSTAPSDNATITNATEVVTTDEGENGNPVSIGSMAPTGNVQFPSGGPDAGQYFYVGQYMNGQEIFTPSFCSSAQGTGSTAAFSGTYTATATYPSPSDVPSEICVNNYDLGGSQGSPGPARKYDPATNADNSIQQKQWTATLDCAPPAGPQLTITKTADAASVSAGSPIGFTITVGAAASGATVTSASLSDPLPGGSGVDWSISPAYSGPGTCLVGGSAPSQTLSCSFGDMAAGSSATVHVSSATTAESAGTYANTATASGSNASSVQASATTSVLAPALSITKTADDPSVSTGSPIGYTVTVANSSAAGTGTATGVTLSDPLPGGSGIDWSISPAYSGPGTCEIDGSVPTQTLSCSFGDMAPGASASVQITSPTGASSAGSYTNTATASATNAINSVQASATTAVLAPALSLRKTADAASVSTGSRIGFRMTVSNSSAAGTGTASDVTLTDPLPSGSGVNWSIKPAYTGEGTCVVNGSAPSQTLSCSFGDMAPGASVTVHVSSATTAASAGTFANTATASASNVGSVQASARTVVLPPHLSIRKTADRATVTAGSPIGFRVHVWNSSASGTGTAAHVTLSDPLPGRPGVKWRISPSYSGPGSCKITGTAPKQKLSCSFGSLAPGAGVSVHVRSGTSGESAGTYHNTATASAKNARKPVKASASVVVKAIVKVFLGYADGLRTAGNHTPGGPWYGSPNTRFVGCPNDYCANGNHLYDGGAILIRNFLTRPLTLSSAKVVIGGCTFTPWASNLKIPGRVGSTFGAIVLTETKGTSPQLSQKTCRVGRLSDFTAGDNFDTSDTVPGGCQFRGSNDGFIPRITLELNGVTIVIRDKAQILNTKGTDLGCRGHNETIPWTFLKTWVFGSATRPFGTAVAHRAPASVAVLDTWFGRIAPVRLG